MMHELTIIARMLLDLLTGGDPTIPSGHPELIPLARLFAVLASIIQEVSQ